MSDKPSPAEEPATLRVRAERAVAAWESADPAVDRGRSAIELAETLHELRVHQIELEMQNDELRQAQRVIEESRARYLNLYHLAPVGYCTLDSSGLVSEANVPLAALLELERSALLGRPLSDFIVPSDQDIYYRHRRALLIEDGPFSCELRFRRVQGPVHVRVETVIHRDAVGQVEAFVAVSDVSAAVLAKASLLASEARYRGLFDCSRDALVTMAPPAWTFAAANEATRSLFGFGAELESVQSHTPWSCSPVQQPSGERSEDGFRAQLDRALTEGSCAFEWTFRGTNGEPFSSSVLLSSMQLDGRLWVLASLRDESELSRAHRALAESDRLANLGILASGLAHELNNPLSVLQLAVEALQESLADLRPASESVPWSTWEARVGEVASGALRIQQLSKALGAFSRPETVSAGLVDLNAMVEQAIRVVAQERRAPTPVARELGSIPKVRGAEGMLSQLFVNLVGAAFHSFVPGGPSLQEVTVRTHANGDWVFAEVEAPGAPLTPEHLARFFEPVFTAATHSGSGIALAACRRIVAELGGEATVENHPVLGVLVRLKLPRAAASEEGAVLSAAPEPAISGRVLVVDDEPQLRSAMARMLGKFHSVVEAADGNEAYRLLQEDGAFDAIVCDLLMPGLGGLELHRLIAGTDPGLARRMIFVTGGSSSSPAVLEGMGNSVLEKPFDGKVFRKLVRKMVETSRA